MLKITVTRGDGGQRILKLEGKLMAPWVPEFLEACRGAFAESISLRLDLSGLSFADNSGIVALRELIHQGVSITATSPFVGELIKEN